MPPRSILIKKGNVTEYITNPKDGMNNGVLNF
jgi:hypothetical protein